MTETTFSDPPALISVIVPIYNVADYVAACIESLRNQTYTRIEVLMIDDGSVDDSAEVAKRAAAGDTRFRLISQPNAGLSAARNRGLETASGDLIAFVDSDDRVASEFLEVLTRALTADDADWVACAIRNHHPNGQQSVHSAIYDSPAISLYPSPTRFAFDTAIDVIRHYPSAWNKLYRRSLIGETRFENGIWFEDHGFYHRLAARTDHLLHVPHALYHQTRGRVGQITETDDPRVFEQFTVLDDLLPRLRNQPDGEAAADILASRLVYERSTALREPDRRRRFAEATRLYFEDNGLTYRANLASGASTAWEHELRGETLLSVILPWRSGDTAPLKATLTTIAQSHGPGRDLIIVCDTAQDTETARALAPPGTCVLKQKASGTGAARIAGFNAAKGTYVTFLNAGDRPDPWAWHDWVEAMLKYDAQVGLSAFETGPDATPSSGFEADKGPLPGLFEPTPEQILATDLTLSAKIFNRAFLTSERLHPTPTRHSGWALVLGALLMTERALYMARPSVHLNAQGSPERRDNLLRLTRDLARVNSALPTTLTQTLPYGWQRRLYARALRHWLLDVPTRGRVGQVLATGAAAMMIAALGYGQTGRAWAAGFDANIGLKFARLFDLTSLGRLMRKRERVRLAAGGLLPEDAVAPPISPRHDPLGHPTFSFPFSDRAYLRLRISFQQTSTAQITFYSGTGRTVPLHVSLHQDRGQIVINDTRSDGIWRAPRCDKVSLSRTGEVLTLSLRNREAKLWLGGRKILTFGARSIWNREGITGLRAITHVQTQGHVSVLDMHTGADPGLTLDGRFQLRAAGKADQVTLRASTLDDALPVYAMPTEPDRAGLRAPLPARAWSPLPANGTLTLRLSSADKEHTLALTRADMARRIRHVLAQTVPLGDGDLILTMIEHIRLGELGPLLSTGAQNEMMRLATAYGLADYLAPAFDGLRPTLPHPDVSDPAMAVIADISTAMRQTPQPDLVDLLRLLSMPRGHEAKVFLSLVEAFWDDDTAMTALMAEVRRRHLSPMPLLGQNSWARSALLPFLLMEGRVSELKTVLKDLAKPDSAWLVTPALAWLGHQVIARHPALDEPDIETVLIGLIETLHARAPNYWERTQCRALTGWAAALIRDHDNWHPDIQATIISFCLKVYGLSRGFWEDLGPRLGTLPPEITQAGAAFAYLIEETADTAKRAAALEVLQALGVGGVMRARTDYLGPAGTHLPRPDQLTPGALAGLPVQARSRAALRHMAFPGHSDTIADPSVVTTVRDTISALQTDQEPSPYTALQSRLSAQITAWLEDPAPLLDDAQKQALLLVNLAILGTERSRYLGLGLALALVAALREDSHAPLRRTVAQWLLDQDVPDPDDPCQETGYWRRQAPCVLEGLSCLRASQVPEGAAVLAHYTRLPPHTTDLGALTRPLPDLPTRPETQTAGLPAPHPLNNILVTVFSCQAYLNTRIPALRSGWLKQLESLGISYVIVVGGGDESLRDDVLWLDAPDDYEGLPQKTLATIAWVSRHTTYSALYKIDDDCFVNAPLLFGELNWRKADYMGRRIHRMPGQTDRSWHHAKSTSNRGRFEIDKSPEPSLYADGGAGYILSRRAMQAALEAAQSPEGQALMAVSFMEDKLLGDLLNLQGIHMTPIRYHAAVQRRSFRDAVPVPYWNSNFQPSKIAPIHQVHMDTHLGQKTLNDGLARAQLHPKKIWPSFQSPRLGYQSNTLDLLSPEDRVARAADAQVAVVAVMRNERFMLPHFLKHYRSLGVDAFLIADNLSDDGTREVLLAEEDVALFSVDTDYNRSHYGVAWQQAMLAAFRCGKWSVVADADELLVWQEKQSQTLPDLLGSKRFQNVDAAQVFMLDMYPKGPLEDADFKSASPFAQAPFADAVPFLENRLNRGPYSDQTLWTSALRHRLLPNATHDMFAAQKTALLRYQPWMQLAAGLHFASPIRFSAQQLFFGHFKYNSDFRRKAIEETARKQHFNNAMEYQKYMALTAEGRSVLFDKDLSRVWTEIPFVRARLTP